MTYRELLAWPHPPLSMEAEMDDVGEDDYRARLDAGLNADLEAGMAELNDMAATLEAARKTTEEEPSSAAPLILAAAAAALFLALR